MAAKAPRDWQAKVAKLSNVGRLVHLAMRQTDEDVAAIRVELLKARRRAYESELTIQARRVGCGKRRGSLGNNATLVDLNAVSEREAAGIVNTYNYDLARAIQHIHEDVPTANRHVYAKRLSAWDTDRAVDKAAVIAEYTEGTARSAAQADFYAFNASIMGVAELVPKTAKCPICQGWINRGEIPLYVATNNPPPYHVRCPHIFNTKPDKVASSECGHLWMGE